MKTVLLLRHAKSDWGDADLADFDRPLAKRGLKDAPCVGDVLLGLDFKPDLIISSPALRARQTAELVAQACGYKKSIEWDASFYGGGSEDMLKALQRLSNTVERVLLVGHNPTLEETTTDLLSRPEAGWHEEFSIRIPTAGLLCLELPLTDWAVLEPGEAVLHWFVIPRLVKAVTQA